MGRNKKVFNNPRQLSLFDWHEMVPKAPKPTPGSLNYDAELRALLEQVLKDCPYDRKEVAFRMSLLTDQNITKNQLDSWTGDNRSGWNFPFKYAAAFEEATGSYALTELQARKRGCKVLVGEEVLKAELGKLNIEEARIKKRRKQLQKKLEGK